MIVLLRKENPMENSPPHIITWNPPKNPLSAKVWSTLYADTPIESQIEMMKEIMVNLGISFIKAGDMTVDDGFVWTIDKHIKAGSASSTIINSMGYMHSFKKFNEICSTVIKSLFRRGILDDDETGYIMTKGAMENADRIKNDIVSFLCTYAAFVKISISDEVSSSEKMFSFKDIIESDDLFNKFIVYWNPDEVIPSYPNVEEDILWPAQLDAVEGPDVDPGIDDADDYDERLERHLKAYEDIMRDIDNIYSARDEGMYNAFLDDTRVIVNKYKLLLVPDNINAENADDEKDGD
jgi:hypothetical protein